MIEPLNWDLLRTFEAVARLGTLTAASKALGVSQSTVSRQLDKLEDRAGSPLLLRGAPLRLTERGLALLEALRPMVDAALAAGAALEESPQLRGEVTITTVAELVRWVLVAQLPAFHRAYPELRLRLLADNRVTSLAAGEADIALRFARPVRGELVGRKLQTMSYAYYSARGAELGPQPAWLGFAGSLAHVAEQRHAERVFADRAPRLLFEDVESLGQAVAAGLGVAILARGLAERIEGLVEREPEELGIASREPPPTRELWLVVHRSRQQLPKIRAVMEWLVRSFDATPDS